MSRASGKHSRDIRHRGLLCSECAHTYPVTDVESVSPRGMRRVPQSPAYRLLASRISTARNTVPTHQPSPVLRQRRESQGSGRPVRAVRPFSFLRTDAPSRRHPPTRIIRLPNRHPRPRPSNPRSRADSLGSPASPIDPSPEPSCLFTTAPGPPRRSRRAASRRRTGSTQRCNAPHS